jgi:hypothetical protein
MNDRTKFYSEYIPRMQQYWEKNKKRIKRLEFRLSKEKDPKKKQRLQDLIDSQKEKFLEKTEFGEHADDDRVWSKEDLLNFREQERVKREKKKDEKFISTQPTGMVEAHARQVFNEALRGEEISSPPYGKRMWAIERLIKRKFILQGDAIPKKIIERRLERKRERGDERDESVLISEIKKELYDKQVNSLQPWIDYLKDELIGSIHFKIYTLNEILHLKNGANGVWETRNKTTDEFPLFVADDVHRTLGVLRGILYPTVSGGGLPLFEHAKGAIEVMNWTRAQKDRMIEAVREKSFPKMFRVLNENLKPKVYEQKESVGVWKKFSLTGKNEAQQKSEILELAKLSQNSESFCLRGEDTAEDYLKEGDIYVYNVVGTRSVGTNNKGQEEFVEEELPEIAIHVVNGHIVQLRGNEKGQNLHPKFIKILRDKLESGEIEGGKKYAEDNKLKFEDTVKLWEMKEWSEKFDPEPESDIVSDLPDLSNENLLWLYGIENGIERKIETFGLNQNWVNELKTEILENRYYQLKKRGLIPKDEELVNDGGWFGLNSQRMFRVDMSRIFNCNPKFMEVAKDNIFSTGLMSLQRSNGINKNTEMYIGTLHGIDFSSNKLKIILGHLILDSEEEKENFLEMGIKVVGGSVVIT